MTVRTIRKVADTPTLLALALEATLSRRNCQVDIEALTGVIDQDGTHLVVMSMLHNDVEVRTQWMVKLAGTMSPAMIWLDMPIASFNALTEMTVEDDGTTPGKEPR